MKHQQARVGMSACGLDVPAQPVIISLSTLFTKPPPILQSIESFIIICSSFSAADDTP